MARRLVKDGRSPVRLVLLMVALAAAGLVTPIAAAAGTPATSAAAGTPATNATVTNAAVPAAAKPAAVRTTTTLTVSPALRAYAGTSRAYVKVIGTNKKVPAGIVTFTLDGKVFSRLRLPASGSVSALVPKTAAVGRRVVAATFAPSVPAQWVSSTARRAIDVIKVSPSWSLKASLATYGRTATVTVALKGAVAVRGIVTLTKGSQVLWRASLSATGTATLRYTENWLPARRALRVTYSGSATVQPGALEIAVSPSRASSAASLSTPTVVAYSKGSTATVTVSGGSPVPTGSVTVYVDGQSRGSASLASGRASVSVPALASGRHSVYARYAGNGYYLPATSKAVAFTTAAAPAPSNPCPASASACVDLTHSLTWLQSGGKITYGPVRMSSGRPGYRTEDGTFSIYWRDIDHHSSEFNNAPMPYAQFFDGGIAFHEGDPDVESHGCVHLTYDAATYYWSHLGVGDEVYVWGYAPY